MSSVRHVSATGNASSDTANIQGAITELTTTENREGPKVVILTGDHYKINEPLVAGELGGIEDPYSKPSNLPQIIGAGVANLEWVGDKTSEYMLNYLDPYGRPQDYIANLCLWCDSKVRGIRVQHATYHMSLRNVRIRDSYEVGFDLIDCWSSNINNLAVEGRGVAYRLIGFNSCSMRDIMARSMVDSDYPATDDSSVYKYDGTYVRTYTARQAAIHYEGGSLTAGNIMLVNNTGRRGVWMSTSRSEWNNVRLENSEYSDEIFSVDDTSLLTVRHVGPSGNKTPAFVRAEDDCRDIHLDQIDGHDISNGMIVCDGGTHSGHRVERIFDGLKDNVSLDRYIVEKNNPVMSGSPSCDNSQSVSIPKMDHIRYA